MPQFPDQVAQFIADHQLFDKSNRLLLAVSGGLDSVIMAHVLHNLGFKIAIAHVNYQLRGEASDQDMAFVKSLALSRDAEFYGLTVDTFQEKAGRESTQMVARRIRYDYFEELLNEYAYDYVLTAHHQDDHLETTLINLIRGTGIRGLSSLPVSQGTVRRPLLGVTREDIRAYALSEGLIWREDASNRTDAYLRNRVRDQLTPLLKDLGLTASSYRNTVRHLNLARTYFEASIKRTRADLVRTYGIKTVAKLTCGISTTAQIDLFQELLPEAVFLNEDYRQLLTGRRGLQINRAGYVACIDGDTLVIQPIAEPISPVSSDTITSLPTTIVSGGKSFEISLIERPTDLVHPTSSFLSPGPFQMVGSANLKISLRSRVDGDRLQPFGLRGKTKKLKDFFIDLKVPVASRDSYTLFVSPNGVVQAIVGIGTTYTGRVMPDDTRVIAITSIE